MVGWGGSCRGRMHHVGWCQVGHGGVVLGRAYRGRVGWGMQGLGEVHHTGVEWAVKNVTE